MEIAEGVKKFLTETLTFVDGPEDLDMVIEFFGVAGKGKTNNANGTLWMQGAVLLEAAKLGLGNPLFISPMTLKKWWTDNAYADKPEVQNAIEDREKLAFDDHNVAEAGGLAILGFRWHQYKAGVFRPNDYEREKICGWQRMLTDD